MILRKLDTLVSDVGELVVWRVGNVEWKLEHEVAIKLSAWMWVEARFAKRCAGDRSSAFAAVGILHNATPDKKPPKLRAVRNVEWLRARDIAVKHAGSMVQVHIGRHSMRMGYDDARKMSIHLRLHGKIARNAARDTRKWADIGNVEIAQAGESPLRQRQH